MSGSGKIIDFVALTNAGVTGMKLKLDTFSQPGGNDAPGTTLSCLCIDNTISFSSLVSKTAMVRKPVNNAS